MTDPGSGALAEAAARILDAYDRAAAVDRARVALPATLAEAESLQRRIVALRRARGERPLGYKIGFTNRTIWPLYGVHHPIWAPVWDSTVTRLDATRAEVDLARFVEPRLEPEIVFGLHSTPADASPQAVYDALAWVAHGFEIVQSPFPGWKFSAAESIAVQSLHGALLIGPRKAGRAMPDMQALASFTLDLFLDGRPAAHGEAAAVLDGPLHALCHLVAELARRGESLAADAVVTTGTLTDAQPLVPGQTWASRLAGIELPGLALVTR